MKKAFWAAFLLLVSTPAFAAYVPNNVKAEDSASADADNLTPIAAVRKATPANTSGTDGDYEPLQISAGRLWTSSTIDAALPAGTNAIGKLSANSGVDIGDVDVTSVPTDPFGANADAASATGSISAKLRFIASTGIPITGTVTVTNSGTFATQDSQVLADNAAFTDGTSKVWPMGAIYDEVAGTALTENDVAAPRINVNRALINAIEDGATRGRYATVTASNALKVDNSGVTQPVSGTVTVTDGAGALNVIIDSGTTAVTNAGTFAVQVDGNALTSLQLIDDVVHSGDASLSKYAVVGGVFDDVATATVTENNAGSARISSRRAWLVEGVASGTAVGVSAASGAFASGSIASGALASGSIASGALASGSISAGAIAAGATSIADNEDVGSADADRGVKVLAVRKATPANTSGTDGDYEFLQISAGRVWASSNIDQINGVTPLMGAGNTGTGSPRVTIATDQAALVGLGVYTEDAAETAGGNLGMAGTVRRDIQASSAGTTGDNATLNTDASGNLWVTGTVIEDAAETAGGQLHMSGSVRRDTAASSAGTTGDNSTINTDANGLLWERHRDPCTALLPTTVAVSQTASTKLISQAASKKNYICGATLVAGAAEIVNIVEGTGTTCATGTAAVAGSTTAANGMSFAANGGFTINRTIQGTGTNLDLCLTQSGSNRVSGYITYVQE